MNVLTRKLRDKGYSLDEYCKLIGQCLKWHRMHEREGSTHHDKIVSFINELESK